MKTIRIAKSVACFFVAALIAIAIWVGVAPPVCVTAQAAAFSYDITRYSVDMQISSSREVTVKEEIEVYFTGTHSHGIIRDFTLDNGVYYYGINATCDHSDFSFYSEHDSNVISVYMRGEGIVTNQTRTYTLSYRMIVPPLAEEGYLPLDVIGYGWNTTIENVTVRVTVSELPKGYKIYSGYAGTVGNDCNAQISWNQNVATITADSLQMYSGITLDLSFSEGVLTPYFDMSVIWAMLTGLLIFGIAIVFKLLFKKQPQITETVNFAPPEGIDPLHMGKLIDNSVDGEDIGSLVFWFAEKGYLTITLTEDDNNPMITATGKPLPDSEPAYRREIFEGLFKEKNQLYISELDEDFGSVVETVKMMVPTVPEGIHSKKSKLLCFLSALISAGLIALFGLIWGSYVIYDFSYFATLLIAIVSVIPSTIASIFANTRENKWSKGKKLWCKLGFSLLGILLGLIMTWFGGYGFSILSGLLLSVSGAISGLLAGDMLCRTPQYNDLLGQILGFKNFILYTEKDKIEFMLSEKPELYYHILPYAQVLGVTDAWTDKFEGLNMSPPTYVYGTEYVAWSYLRYRTIYNAMRSRTLYAYREHREAVSHSGSGGVGGGFGGGFGGGGFGGGGGRGC